jgi:hypothetical protein
MDLEKEKLEWTRPVQQQESSTTTTTTIRYNFDGIIITDSMDIPSHSGLYHHGDGIPSSLLIS